MNIIRYSRRMAQGVLMLLFTLATVAGVNAQCGDFLTEPLPLTAPVDITVNLTGTTAELSNDLIQSAGSPTFSKDVSCIYQIADDAAFTMGLTSISLLGTTYFDCSDLANIQPLGYLTRFVRVNNGFGGSGGPSTLNGQFREIHFYVYDQIPPAMPAIAAVNANTGPAATVCSVTAASIGASLNAGPTDNCLVTSLTWSLTGATTLNSSVTGINQLSVSGISFNVGATVATYTASDASGNTTTRSFTITITDNTPPVITSCPSGMSPLNRNADAGVCTYTYLAGDPQVTATDNCPGPMPSASLVTFNYALTGATTATVSTLTGTVFNKGTTNVVATAVAGMLSSMPCNFSVVVADTQKPAIAATSDLTLFTSDNISTPMNLCDADTSWTHPAVTDNCPGPYVLEMSNNGGAYVTVTPGASSGNITFPTPGTYFIAYRATDNAMLLSVDTFTVTVKDNVAPAVTFANQTYSVNAAMMSCAELVQFIRPSLAGSGVNDCGAVTLTEVVTGPDTDVLDPYGMFNPAAASNTPTLALFPVGVTVITYTYSDNATPANTTTRTVTITVVNTEPPVALCQPNNSVSLALDNAGNATVNASMINNGSSDNCAIDTMTVSPASFGCGALLGTGQHVVTLTVTDFNNLSSTCTTIVSVIDNIAPVVTCPANSTVSANASCQGNISAVVNATDNCSIHEWKYQENGGALTLFAGAPTTATLSFLNKPAGVYNYVIRAEDIKDNADVCNFTVVIADQTPPSLDNPATMAIETCPPNITVNANLAPGCAYRKPNSATCIVDALVPANQWCGTVAFYDNCDLPSSVSNLPSLTQTYALGANPITISKTDAAGNVTNCTFTITVVDVQAPVAKCKNITAQLDGTGNVTVTALQLEDGSTDNCYLDLLFKVKKPADAMFGNSVSFNCSQIGMQTVQYQATEDVAGGLSGTTSCIVTVQDLVKPLCIAQNVSLQLSATIPGMVTLTASALNNGSSDNCSNAAALTYSVSNSATGPFAATLDFDCTPLGANTVYLRVTDAYGNSTDPSNPMTPCAAVVTIQDVTAPTVVSVPPSITVDCNVVGANSANTAGINTYLNSLSDAVFSDNCAVITPINETAVVTPGICPNSFTITRTWIASDASGGTAQAQQVITVRDNTIPTFTVPANETLTLNSAATCNVIKSYTASALNDNCSATGTLTTTWEIDYAGTTPANTVGTGLTATPVAPGFNLGDNFITFRVTDECGNTATKTITVTVVDNVPPSYAGYIQPSPSTASYCNAVMPQVNLSAGCTYSFSWYRPYAGAPITFPLVVNPDITDCNTMTVVESIVTTPPVGAAQAQVPSIPFNQDEVLNALVPTTISIPVGTTVFKYVTTDSKGNVDSCKFSIKINDIAAPILNCPANVTLNSICPTAQVPNYLNLVNFTDNCSSNVTVSQSKLGLALNNPLIAYLSTPSIPAADPADGSEFEIVFTATDGTNSAVPCTTKVILDDVQSPLPDSASLADLVWDCGFAYVSAPTAKTNDCGLNTGATIYGTPGGVSAIGIVTLPSNPLIITKYKITSPPGTYFITWSYNDGNNNVSTQLQKLTINPDNKKPIPVCKTALTQLVLNAAGTASLTAAMIDNGSYDQSDCGPYPSVDSVKLSLSQTAFTCADLSKTTVTLTVTDFGGNDTTCTSPIKVIDNILPVINMATVPADTTYKVCAIGFVLPAAPTVTATDNCSALVSFAQVSTQGTSGASKYNYTVTRTWTATDAAGNTAQKSQVITVLDDVKPVFATVAPASLMFNTPLVTTVCAGSVTFKLANFVSDCAPDNELNITVTPAYFSLTDTSEVLPVGSHTVNFTVTDPAGNSATASLTFVVKDATKPVASCINGISVALNANGQAIVTPSLINNQSSDNCGSITLKVQELELINGDTIGSPDTQLVFDCNEADSDTEYPIILWVTDPAGNFNFCETSVVIQDNVAPTITCPASVSVSCSMTPATAFSTTALGNAVATDNCNNNVVNNISYPVITSTDTPTNNGYTCASFVRTFKASDLAGNMASCTQMVTVTDTKPPVFDVKPPSDTIACNDPLVVAPLLTATDNCTPKDSIKIELVEVSTKTTTGCGKYNYTATRTWTATDKCGNSSTHSQVVKVEDNAGPKFTGMPDTINVLTANFPPTTNCTAPVSLNAAQFFNECALLTECTINAIQFSPVLAAPITPNVLNVSGNYPVGTTKVFFTVTDPCGNVGKDSVVIIVKDNSAPIVTCNNNVEVALTNNGLASITVNDIDLNSNDNCGIATRVLSQSNFDCDNLGVNTVTLTVTDIYGNSNSCNASVEVTANAATGFTLDSTVVAPTYFGASNGTATALPLGGSNTFSYSWNTGATTAVLNNIAAGTYTVAVSDQFSGCQQVMTVVVPDGPKVTFTVGNATGAQNTVVKVPVTVNNFSEISGFTFTLNIPNALVGAPGVPALANINPALGTGLNASVSGNTISVLYLNTGANNVSLPQGAVLFNICVQLSNATLGTSSPVNIENAPVAFQVLRGTSIIPTEPVVNGSVQITAGLNEYDIIGDITPWQNPNAGIPNVEVSVAGPVPAQAAVNTTTTGIYQFANITANTNTVTGAEKTQSGNNKIDIIDQGLLLKHIFANATSPSPLTSPYQRVAADVNFDGQINIIDFALIQRLLLGTVQNLEGANAKDWVFIPKSYMFPASTTAPFPNPVYAALPVFPQTIAHTPLFQDQLDDDFIGVRMGDLNGDAPLNIHGGGAIEERGGADLKMRIQDQTVTSGETVSIAFKAKDFVQQNGYQLTFAFDPNVLELQSVVPGVVPGLDADAHFGTTLLSDGLLSTAWVNMEAVTIADDETLFTLVFKATSAVNTLSEVLSVSNEIVAPMAVNNDGEISNISFEFISAVSGVGHTPAQEFVLYQNQPNPFVAQTTVGFRLPAGDRCTLRVYNSNGVLVKTVIGNFEKGYNAIQLRNVDFGGAGVYYYELATPTFSDRKKMVIIH